MGTASRGRTFCGLVSMPLSVHLHVPERALEAISFFYAACCAIGTGHIDEAALAKTKIGRS